MSDTVTPKKRRVGQHPTASEKKEIQQKFLEVFAQTANVTSSCKQAGIPRKTLYEWLERDELFSIQYHQAEQEANDVIRAEIHRRGIDGWDEEVYQLGHYAGTVHKYSDTLLIFHAKARMSEYRDKQPDVNVNVTNNPGVIPVNTKDLTDDELVMLKSIALKQRSRQGE